MTLRFTPEEIRTLYDRLAHTYDALSSVPDWLGLSRVRRRLVQKARGRVLEVAAGTGRNLRFYPAGCEITLLDLSPSMLAEARKRAERLGLTNVSFVTGDAAALPFPDRSFDTVVSTLSTCTFPDPVAALREMARVCRRGGRILLLEHGRSDRRWLAWYQDRTAERHARAVGCFWNREPLRLVRQAGLTPAEIRSCLLGIIQVMEIPV
ncbi:MAG: methyltransferase domain-containing protein [Firmicutes bacterium]|nr:methyltransferase domain-containing protein [Bacillota bacterium]